MIWVSLLGKSKTLPLYFLVPFSHCFCFHFLGKQTGVYYEKLEACFFACTIEEIYDVGLHLEFLFFLFLFLFEGSVRIF